MRARSWLMVVGMVGLWTLGSCGDEKDTTSGECPDELSYSKTAEPFVDKYCITCHSESLSGFARNGAPDDVNFGDEADLFTHGTHVSEYVSGKLMPPPGALQPSDAERADFVAWTKCSGASESHDHN
jgi:mono/diheme cytochrome c family protein